jgi:hypothetical protein
MTHADDSHHQAKARLVMDILHRAILHHGFWFTEVRHQMGSRRALEILGSMLDRSLGIQLNRLAKVLGFEMQDGLPVPLLELAPKKLDQMLEAISANWLANDGLWFQAVEFSSGMNDAKRCNDSCWVHFSPFEAWSIKRFLGLPERPGLQGLKEVLGYRIYAQINIQSIVEDTPQSFIFMMNECRVQMARRRKGLDDYPCKSAGLVEYAYFARAIDDRIQVECIGCPPDEHPQDWFCAWRFKIGDPA